MLYVTQFNMEMCFYKCLPLFAECKTFVSCNCWILWNIYGHTLWWLRAKSSWIERKNELHAVRSLQDDNLCVIKKYGRKICKIQLFSGHMKFECEKEETGHLYGNFAIRSIIATAQNANARHVIMIETSRHLKFEIVFSLFRLRAFQLYWCLCLRFCMRDRNGTVETWVCIVAKMHLVILIGTAVPEMTVLAIDVGENQKIVTEKITSISTIV